MLSGSSQKGTKMNYCSVCLDTSWETAARRARCCFLRMGYRCTVPKPVCDSTSPAARISCFKSQGHRKRIILAFSVTRRYNGASHLPPGGYQGGHLDFGIGGYFREQEKLYTFLSRSTVRFKQTSANWSCWTAHVSGATSKKKKRELMCC